MARPPNRRLMLLDEPASGLSIGERERLTELLLGSPEDVTLILIEHDMDVALNVADYVTMMHDGTRSSRAHRRRFAATRWCTTSISESLPRRGRRARGGARVSEVLLEIEGLDAMYG